jgi:hypothetical protein
MTGQSRRMLLSVRFHPKQPFRSAKIQENDRLLSARSGLMHCKKKPRHEGGEIPASKFLPYGYGVNVVRAKWREL